MSDPDIFTSEFTQDELMATLTQEAMRRNGQASSKATLLTFQVTDDRRVIGVTVRFSNRLGYKQIEAIVNGEIE